MRITMRTLSVGPQGSMEPGKTYDVDDDFARSLIAYGFAFEACGAVNTSNPNGTGTTGPKGDPGADGKSAYQIAVDNGFMGAVEEWLVSLMGPASIIPGPDGPAGADSTIPGPKGDKGDTGIQGPDGITAYTLSVQALTSSPTDAQTVYFGNLPKAPTTTAGISRVYIPKTGTIKAIRIWCYSGTAGTNEAWSLYIRLNNTTDTLIATLSLNTAARDFSNTGLNIAVTAGDYFEIKGIQPTWATNPLTTIFGGYVYIE
jgi:hypothetical protein